MFKFRGLSESGIWRYGEYRDSVHWEGKTRPAIYVPKDGLYFISDVATVGLCSGKTDMNGEDLYPGDVFQNKKGTRFELRYGSYIMYCPVDDCMMENVGFYVVADGYYEDMPLGPTEEYATKIGNIFENPELKVDPKYRCNAETGCNILEEPDRIRAAVETPAVVEV